MAFDISKYQLINQNIRIYGPYFLRSLSSVQYSKCTQFHKSFFCLMNKGKDICHKVLLKEGTNREPSILLDNSVFGITITTTWKNYRCSYGIFAFGYLYITTMFSKRQFIFYLILFCVHFLFLPWVLCCYN